MKLRPFEKEVLRAKGNAQELLYKFYNKKIGQNNAEKQFAGIRTHLNYVAEFEEEQAERTIGEMEETVVKADGSITTKRLLLLSEEDSKNPTRIMELMGFDILQWAVVSCKIRRNYWDVTMKLAQGSDEHGHKNQELPHKETNHAFECTLSVKPIQNIVSVDLIKEVFDSLETPKIKPIPRTEKGNVLVEPSILDFHLGKGLSLQEEVTLYETTLMEMLSKLRNNNISPEKFLFQVGQDFIHIDNSNKTTTAGTSVDTNAGLWSNIYRTAVELIIWTAEQLRNLAPVHFVYVPGNHDRTLAYCLALNLHTKYADCPDVTVDVTDYPRKYYQYGLNAIGMSHGRDEGKRIQNKMQEEAVDMFAATTYREFHLGDLHHEKLDEVGGIIYRRTSAITDLDQWHINKGYKAIRKAPMYIWHKEGGNDIINVLVKV